MKMGRPLTDDIRAAINGQLTAAPGPSNKTRERRTSSGLWARPFASEALGVSPDQIPEATEALRKAGVTAEFDKEGRCIVSSDKQFREVAKACGMWDGRDGFGSKDPETGQRHLTGREIEQRKQEFRDAVERGDYN